jgi:3-isopropylmalate/(R)-2-methylmalate dehydratase large subunit
LLFEDHLCHVQGAEWQASVQHQRAFAERAGVRLRENMSSPGCDGICHSVIIEEGLVTPGQICVGTDSQTCTVGVLGALAFGIGTTSMAGALLSGEVLLEVPPTVRVELAGDLTRGVAAKDVMLHFLSLPDVAMGCCVGRMLEFAGSALSRWSLDQQLVLTNMAVEAGAFSGIIGAPTPAVCRHLHQTRGMTTSEIIAAWPVSAGKASCDLVIELDLSRVQPMVALPCKPSNAVPVEQLAGKAFTSGFIGSCTGGNLSDLRAAAHVLAGETLAVPLVVQPATMRIMEIAAEEGLLDVFAAVGALVLRPGCGACCGLGPGGVQCAGDVVLSATARNYPGRMGWPGAEVAGEVLLASPATVAMSCVRGGLSTPIVDV